MMAMRIMAIILAFGLATACNSSGPQNTQPATVYGSAIAVSSGDKQIGASGAALDEPVVVQVNDAQGTATPGAAVVMEGPPGVRFAPVTRLTDSSGQFTTVVSLGGQAGRYQLAAVTQDRGGKRFSAKFDEIALGYQSMLGRQLNNQYCDRCHNPESTAVRVSNFDNLSAKPHAFSEGDVLNKFTDADLTAIISQGGPALGRSAEMPPWGYTLSKADMQALVAYIRAVSDPPYRTKGVVYAQVH